MILVIGDLEFGTCRDYNTYYGFTTIMIYTHPMCDMYLVIIF